MVPLKKTPIVPNNHGYYTEWHQERNNTHLGMMRSMMERELDKERQRLSNALSAIPRLIAEARQMNIEEVSAKTELSVAEILLDNWDSVLQLAVANEKLKGEVERLLKQIEQMSQAIYTAVESAIRPVRDERVHDNPPSSDI